MNLPQEFADSMIAYMGKDEYDRLAAALDTTPPVSMRLNPSKMTADERKDIVKRMKATRVPWCDMGFYLAERPQFTFDPLLHAGCYYVQEASSMFVWHIISQYLSGNIGEQETPPAQDVHSPITALDLCAAPGGKSTLALSLLPKGSILVANEAIRQRANILAENIVKWGNPNCIVTNNYAEDFASFDETFDIIICDAPCSGEGMFRKDHNSINEWSPANVVACSKTQKDITSDIWHALKPGGLLIYSTCTYNPHEDEENVKWIADHLGAEILSCHPDKEWHLTETNTHFFPHIVKGEGFFVSILKKKDDECESGPQGNSIRKKSKERKISSKDKTPQELKDWLEEGSDYEIYEHNGTYHAFPSIHKNLLKKAQESLRIVHAGIELARPKGKKLQPSHSLALSTSLNPSAFPQVELDSTQAIAYLRTEALSLPSDTPIGYVLLTYQGHPLGFANNIGNRANNLYPQEWKIRSTHIENIQ